MSDTAFKVGDVVVLKTGVSYAPKMVVKATNGEVSVCMWYNSTTHQFEENKFPNETIMKP